MKNSDTNHLRVSITPRIDKRMSFLVGYVDALKAPEQEQAASKKGSGRRFVNAGQEEKPLEGGKRGEAKIGDDPGYYLPEEVADSYIASLFPSEPQHEYRHSKKKSQSRGRDGYV